MKNIIFINLGDKILRVLLWVPGVPGMDNKLDNSNH